MKDSSTQKWRTVTLGTICEFRRGLTYKKSDEVDSEGTPVLRANNVDLATGELKLDEVRYIDPRIEVPISKKVVAGSLLICTASGSKKHLGKTALIEDQMDLAFGGFMGLLIPHPTILPKYLQWRLRSDAYWSFIDGLSDGANINNLKFKQLSEFPVPLPPLEEQQRIVAVLDEALEGLARARAHAEANLRNTFDLKQAWLNEAFRPLNHSREAVKGVAKTGWETRPLGEVAQIRPNKKEAKSILADKDEVSFVPMECLNVDQVALDEHKTRTLGEVYNGYTYFRDGDVLLAKITPCFENGKLGIAGNLTNGIGFGSSEFFVIRPSEELSAGYLYHFLNRQTFRDWAKGQMTGAVGHKRVPKELIETLEVPLPPLEEQQRIVAVLDEALQQTKQASMAYVTQIRNIDDLRQSLLQQAFAGELK